jgi:hypothetical protein
MAGVNLSSLILHDKWPGVATDRLGKPSDGWDNTRHCFKTTEAGQSPPVPVGTKIAAYTDNSWAPGWYTMIYLMYHSYEAAALYDVSKDISDGFPACTHADGSTAEMYNTDTSTMPWYVVSRCITNVSSDITNQAAVAIPCWTASSDGTLCFSSASRTGSYGDSYGWFWVGGVCPAKDATLLDGTAGTGVGACVSGDFATRAKGAVYLETTAAISTVMLTCDTTLACDGTAQKLSPIGWICATAV